MSKNAISFHQLYTKYANDVYRFSFWLTGDTEEAKDVTSETFVRLWTSQAETRHETVKAYLFTIARNLCLQNKRRKKRFIPLDEELQDKSGQSDRTAQDRLDLDDALNALQTLLEIDRAVLIMKAEDELSYEDIAKSTGLSVANVKVKIFRARMKIRSLLKTQKGENPCK